VILPTPCKGTVAQLVNKLPAFYGTPSLKMDLKETGLKSAEWIHVAQDRELWLVVVITVMNHWIL
jgi:hypothetical protein